MKKRSLGVLLLVAMLFCACGKDTPQVEDNSNIQQTVTNGVVDNTTPEPTEVPEPTAIPDSEVFSLMLQNALDTGEEKVAELSKTKERENKAVNGNVEISLPGALLGTDASLNVEVDTTCYISEDSRVKMLIDIAMNDEDLVSGEIYVDEDLNLIVGVPDDVDDYLSIPVAVTGMEESVEFSVEDFDADVFEDAFKIVKKGILKSLKFDRVEKDYTVGKLDKSLTGTAYFSDVDITKVMDAVEEACAVLQDAGLPITFEEFEDVDEEELDKVQLAYITDGKYKSYELINVEDEVSIGFVFCEEGVSIYGHDEYDTEELFRYDKTDGNEGTFYLYLEGEEFSGDYKNDKYGLVEITDILVGDTGIVIDTVRYGNGLFSVMFGTDLGDDGKLNFALNLSESEGSIGFNMGAGQDTLRFNLEYKEAKYKDFEIPDADMEDAEEFLMELLENNEALMELLVVKEPYEEIPNDSVYPEEDLYEGF